MSHNANKSIRDIKLRQISISMEAANVLRLAILEDVEKRYKFTDGRKAKLRPFIEPHFNDQGHPEFSVDFVMPDGHVEFTVKMSGYGGTPKEYCHKGDPCQYCGIPWDHVLPGPCPARFKEDPTFEKED